VHGWDAEDWSAHFAVGGSWLSQRGARRGTFAASRRAQVDRLLDPDNGSATIESLQRAARIVGRELRMQLV
jgi:hypothetical protein